MEQQLPEFLQAYQKDDFVFSQEDFPEISLLEMAKWYPLDVNFQIEKIKNIMRLSYMNVMRDLQNQQIEWVDHYVDMFKNAVYTKTMHYIAMQYEAVDTSKSNVTKNITAKMQGLTDTYDNLYQQFLRFLLGKDTVTIDLI